MNFLSKLDYGWVYLICGLVITVSAIVLPAHQHLHDLEAKRAVIQQDLHALQFQMDKYQNFLVELQTSSPALEKRILEMQFNVQTQGTPVVTDISAPSTPLDWISARTQPAKLVTIPSEQSSILSSLSQGRSRLLLFGVGVFALFIGLIKGPIAQKP